ncbi:DUF1641 domain-containing protein [Alicyclobacillus tolerans]|uniref:Uncharacterized conserved protein YjgD, DUF1641 family n=2 Tax=Alicyclobacillus tolerans TaxID=90970 RepID=A0A1M6NFJ1_9BACL|nr:MULTISPECIES: DUF1641 domain-containing protein [Alicyclobacillus]MDP9728323.1 uncharacterized protein YjgD (DUF1641 family) [Alicyclobacillus tengchongensis]QRF23883.1 DUF1641 domain-containing protein [Alicyclobacillus sp. TC]SHJ94495.1 Uncharacterized conserved protein YjgD, DUF1641 family [Alicyclobacillus montanus]
MAQATTAIVRQDNESEQKEKMLQELQQVLAENADGLKSGAELLQELHEKGLLDFLVALIKQGNDVVRILVELVTREQYMKGIQKVMSAVEGFSELDGDSLTAAMKSLLKLLQELSDKGLLDFLVGLLEQGQNIAKVLVDFAAQTAQSKSLQSIISLASEVSNLDGEALGRTLKGVTAGLSKMAESEPNGRPMGIFELLRMMKDPDVSAALQSGFAFLKGMGQALRKTDGQ